MTITINNSLIVLCLFYFFLSAFLSYLFRQANIFFKLIVFFFIAHFFILIESANKIELTIASILGFLFIYADTALDLLFGIKLGIETVVFGFFEMLRQILLFIFRPIANFFTWFYNLLSKFFGWGLVFHRLGEPRPKKESTEPQQTERKSYRKWHKREAPRQTRDKSQEHKERSRPSRYKRRYKASSDNGKGNEQQTSQSKYTNSADKQKEDYIKQAKDQVKQAREQSKRKEQQGSTNTQTANTTTQDNRTYEQILGLRNNFTLDELKDAYKLGISRYHPDKYSHMSENFKKESEVEFIKIKHAYNVLIRRFN